MLRCLTLTLAFLGLVTSRCYKYQSCLYKMQGPNNGSCCLTSHNACHMSLLYLKWFMTDLQVDRWRAEGPWLLPHPWNGFPLPLSFSAQRIPPLLLYSAHSSGGLLDWCVSYGKLGCCLLWKLFSPQGRQQCPVAPDSTTSTWEHCKVHREYLLWTSIYYWQSCW